MKTIHDLFQEAKLENQGRKPALSNLLLCLIQTQDAGEVDDVLEQCNMTRQRFKCAVKPFYNQAHAEDTDIMISGIMDVVGNVSPSGWHLLAALCRAPEHRISRALVVAGLDLVALERKIYFREI